MPASLPAASTEPASVGTPRRGRPTPSGRAAPLPPAERRAAIVAAALPLIRRLGNDVTTRQIAEAAGIAEGTIFRVFPDKDSVIEAAVAHAFESEPTIVQLESIDLDLPLSQRMEQIVDIIRLRLAQVWELLSALRMFGPPEDHHDNRAHHRHLPSVRPSDDRLLQAVTDVLSSSAAELRLPPSEAARVLRLMVFSGTHPRITDDHPLTTQEIVSILLDGIRSHSP